MSLSDAAIRAAKPRERAFKLSDEKGLYVEVAPSGGKWWRLKYRFDGKEKRLSLGVYPDVGLKQARDKRDEARKLLADGIDPGAARKAEKAASTTAAASTFEIVARESHAKNKATWTPAVARRILSALERDAFPSIGNVPCGTLTAPQVLTMLRKIEARGVAYSAGKMREYVGQIMRYAVATGRAERDPSADLRDALTTPKTKHFAAKTEPAEVADLLRKVDAYQGMFSVRIALRLAPMLFQRPGEIRRMRWAELDLEAGTWSYYIPKTRANHLAPLPTQAIVLLRELQAVTGNGEWVFAGVRKGRPISGNTLNAALRAMGIDTQEEHTSHGWRATARTLLHEEIGVDPNVIEHQLSHKVTDVLGPTYNRTRFLAQRRKMMQTWADYLERLKTGVDVTHLPHLRLQAD